MELSPPWAANSSDWQTQNAEEPRQDLLFLFNLSWNWVHVSDVLLEPGQCWPTKWSWLKYQSCEPRFQFQIWDKHSGSPSEKGNYLQGDHCHHRRANSCCKQTPSFLQWAQGVHILDVLSASGKQSRTHRINQNRNLGNHLLTNILQNTQA